MYVLHMYHICLSQVSEDANADDLLARADLLRLNPRCTEWPAAGPRPADCVESQASSQGTHGTLVVPTMCNKPW